MTRHFLKGEAQARFTQDRIDIIPKLAELVHQHDARFMVVCGDVFDANEVAPQTVLRATEKLAAFPAPVFILPGNHDPLNAASVYDSAAFAALPEHIVVIRDNKPLAVPGVPGVEVVAAPWHRKQALSDLCAQMLDTLEPVTEGMVRVALAHGQLSTLSADANHPSIIGMDAVRQSLDENKIQYLALGDRHSVTECDESGRVWYSGTPIATDFTETCPNQVLLVDASVGIDPRAQVQTLKVGEWEFVQLNMAMQSLRDVDKLEKDLSAFENKERVVIRLVLSGGLKLADSAVLNTMIVSRRNLFASLRVNEQQSDLLVVPDALDIESLSLSGYARDAWEELAAQADENGDAAQTASDSLELFYRIAQPQQAL